MAIGEPNAVVRSYQPEDVDAAADLFREGNFQRYMSWLHMHLVVLYTKDMRIPYEGDVCRDCELVHRWRDADPADIPADDIDMLLAVGRRVACMERTIDFRRNFIVTDKTPDEYARWERIDDLACQGRLFRTPQIEMPGPNLKIPDAWLRIANDDTRRKIIEQFKKSHEF